MLAGLFQLRADVHMVMAVRPIEVRVNKSPMAPKRMVVIIGQRAWESSQCYANIRVNMTSSSLLTTERQLYEQENTIPNCCGYSQEKELARQYESLQIKTSWNPVRISLHFVCS